MLGQGFSRRTSLPIILALIASPLAGCGGATSLPGTANARVPDVGRPSAAHRVGKTVVAESVLYYFQNGSDGASPYAGLINVNGVLYGTTCYGGGNSSDGNLGTVYKVTQSGIETVLHSFAGGSDGANPRDSLVSVKGTLYGTTVYGGANNDGTIFKMATSGAGYSLLHTFGGSDGSLPAANLISVNGVLYGTTYQGGANNDGTVFSITSNGQVTVLHDFAGIDGANSDAGLSYVGGTLYGTTKAGGVNNDGVVFSISTSGSGYTVLHSFAGGSDGANPYAGLTAVKNILYGSTYAGGASNNGTVFQMATSGSGYKTLYSFGAAPDGANPQGQLIVLNGTLFGTTINGGSNGVGTVFAVWPGFYGSETVLYSFASANDGADPAAGLLNVKGTLYGTTVNADTRYGPGVVYKLTL